MGTPKPRILPWLRLQLDLGQLEGVAWVDEGRTRFRIPWKHGLRQDAQQEDFRIFQVRGPERGKPGTARPDPRSEAARRGLPAGPGPPRVMELCGPVRLGGGGRAAVRVGTRVPPLAPGRRSQDAEEVPPGGGFWSFGGEAPSPHSGAWAEASGAYTPGKDKEDRPTWKRNFRSALNRKEGLRLVEDRSKDPVDPHKIYEFITPGVGDSPEPDMSPDTSGRDSTPDTQEDILEELLGDMILAPLPDGDPSGMAMASEPPPQLLLSPCLDIHAPCPDLAPPENPLRGLLVPEDEWEFEVTVFYRGRQTFQQTVFCPRGLRLVGSEAEDQMLPGQPIRLPDPESALMDQGVVGYVRRVLSCLGGGLALWREGQRLWARRLGQCHTYWAMGEELLPNSRHGPDGEVPKNKDGSVFDLRPFVADLIAFIEGSGRSPRYTLWFCMGEAWPQDQPWVKRLVMVKVVPTCLRALLDMARAGGASSLENTVDLHISNSQPLSLTSDQYKAFLQDLVEDMDCQAMGEA